MKIAESVQVTVEYHIVTTSDWTKFEIVSGGWWSDIEVECLKGCDRLKKGIVVDGKTIEIRKAPRDKALVEARARCTLNIDRKYLDSDISYLITKGDIESTTVKIIVEGKEITPEKTNLYNIKGNPRNPMAFRVSTSRHVAATKEIGTETDFDDLEKRAKKFRLYETIFNAIASYWYIAVLSVIIEPLIVIRFYGREPKSWEGLLSFVVAGVIFIVLARVTGKRAKKYRLEDNEWATFYTHSIVENLQKRSKTNNLDLKKDYRKRALKHAKDFLFCISKRWKIGTFKLARDRFGKALSELRKNIQFRVIPTLKEEDDKSLENVEQIMRNFLIESKSFSLESIDRINEQMSSKLNETYSMRFRDRLSMSFGAHKVLQHGLFGLTLLTVCCVFYYIAITYFQISRDVVFGSTIVVFVGLLTIYFRRQPKE